MGGQRHPHQVLEGRSCTSTLLTYPHRRKAPRMTLGTEKADPRGATAHVASEGQSTTVPSLPALLHPLRASTHSILTFAAWMFCHC